MLLFSDNKKSVSMQKRDFVVLISARSSWINDICSQLIMKNVSNIETIEKRVVEADTLDIPPSAHTVIVDIEQFTDSQQIIAKIKMLLPGTANCLLVGDSDSIVLSRKFAEAGMSYLLYPSQLTDIVQSVNDSSREITNKRLAIRISLLGCKGGVGTSTLAYHLASYIAENNRVPVLLVQNGGGSQDMDIIADHEMDDGITDITSYLAVKKDSRNQRDDFSERLLTRYNFVIFDCPVYNLEKEQVEQILNQSDCVVLVISHDLSTVRVAKMVLETNRFLQTIQNGVKREFVCLNQTRSNGNGMLSVGDLSTLLEHDISAIISNQRPSSDATKPLRFTGKQHESLVGLVRNILGQNLESRKTIRGFFRLRGFRK